MSVDSQATNSSPIENLITEHIDIWSSAIKRKSNSGRGSSKKIELYGIKKLRELILELAVRGKLVSQDPNDEPASVLLERIAAEKAELVKQGKIKKPKKLPDITEDEKPFELPEGWGFIRLGDVYELEYGDNLPKDKRDESGLINVYGSNGVVGTHSSSSVNAPCIVIGRKGSAGALNLCDDEECWVTDVAYSVSPPSVINIRFSFMQFHTFGLDQLGKGIKPGLNRNEAYPLVIALPPTAEQHRIVAKVDELMALCDQLEAQTESSLDAHQTLVTVLLDTLVNSQNAEELAENWTRISGHFDTLFTTEQSIDQLKQTILQLAVMGKIVEQKTNDEPASVLLERIAAEKADLIKQGKIKKQKPLPPITEEEKPFELPKGWEWCRLGDTSYIYSGNSFKSNDFSNDNGIKVVKITNAGVGELIETEDYLPNQFIDKYKDFLVFQNDIVLALTRPYIADGLKVSVCPESYNLSLLNQRVAVIRPFLYFEYIFLVMRSPYILDVYKNRFNGNGLQPNLKVSDVTDLVFSIPPLEEQHQIVDKVDDLMSICDQLKARLSDAQTTQLNLADALVKEAL
jgi:type I restriction enzyme S subunit